MLPLTSISTAESIPGHGSIDRVGTSRSDILVLLIATVLLFGFLLGSRPLSVPDEGRYAEISREMAVTGDWLTPRLNGVKYFEKPPLVYWFTALSIKLFGLSEWSLRLAPASFALLGCIAVYIAGRILFNAQAGILASVVLSTSFLYYAMGRVLTLDMAVSVLLSASLLCFLIAAGTPQGLARRLWLYGFYSLAALAVLAKGLIGIVLPALVIGVWMLVVNRWRLLREIHLFSGITLFLCISAPWHILVNRANREFFNFYFIHEHFQRYLTTVHHHYKPFWFFIPVLLGGLTPWTAFLAQAVRHSLPPSWTVRQNNPEMMFLLLWAILVFLFFSQSDSKLIPYILPVFPPLALILGKYLADAWEGRHRYGIRAGMTFLLLVDALFIAALLTAHHYRPEIDEHNLRPHLYALAAILFAGAAGSWALRRKIAFPNSITVLIVCTSLFLSLSNTLLPFIETRSIKELADELRPVLKPGDEVISYHAYYQDLPVYLARTVTIAGWLGELEFGAKQEDVSRWMIGEQECWKRWDGPKRVFLVTSKDNYDTLLKNSGRRFHLWDETKRNVLLSNERAYR